MCIWLEIERVPKGPFQSIMTVKWQVVGTRTEGAEDMGLWIQCHLDLVVTVWISDVGFGLRALIT